MDDADLVRLTQELIRIPSPTDSERDLALYLTSVMKPIFDSVVVDDMSNVIGTLEGTGPGPTVVFNAHIDHVDPGAMENPYSGELVDAARFGGSGEAIYGRGASDMKGAVAAMVAAAADLRSSGFNGRLIFTGVVKEERGRSEGTRYVMQNLGVATDVVVSGEATAGDVCLGHRGNAEFELELRGRTAHASDPSQGINAILLMNQFLSAWPRLPMPEGPMVGKCTSAITSITCSPGRLSVVPDRCTLIFDDRFLPGESPDRPERDVRNLLEEIRASNPNFVYELRRRRVVAAWLVSANDPNAVLMGRVVEELSGRAPAKRGWLFGTDGMYLWPEAHIPTIGFGPGEEKFAHAPIDHVPVADLHLARRVYAEFVRRRGES